METMTSSGSDAESTTRPSVVATTATRPARARSTRATIAWHDERSSGAPPTEPEAAPSGPGAPMTSHVIQTGDTFSALATRYLGNAKYAKLIMEANPKCDPRRLQVGATVTIPAAPESAKPASPPPAERRPVTPAAPPVVARAPERSTPTRSAPETVIPADRVYTVQTGEGWYLLAKRFLGEGSRWPELYELNKERASFNPRLLRAGTVIELPVAVASANPPSNTDAIE
jgi:nucleoid-associated protein YgaU